MNSYLFTVIKTNIYSTGLIGIITNSELYTLLTHITTQPSLLLFPVIMHLFNRKTLYFTKSYSLSLKLLVSQVSDNIK